MTEARTRRLLQLQGALPATHQQATASYCLNKSCPSSIVTLCATMMAFTEFTCVRYEEGDKLGKLLAYAALLPYVLILHHASRFYSRRYA